MSNLQTADQAKDNRVLKTGSQPYFIKDTAHPLLAFASRLAFAAFTCGFDLISKKGYQCSISREAQTVEEVEKSRRVTWIWDHAKKATFRPIPAEETISIDEFERRFKSLEWCEANPDHPISYMRVFLEKSREGMAKLKAIEPTHRIRRGDAVATVPASATEEEIDAYFAALHEPEIES